MTEQQVKPIPAEQVDDRNFRLMESSFKFANRITIAIPDPMKIALMDSATRLHLNMSDLVRMAVEDFMPRFYPAYRAFYQQAVVASRQIDQDKE